MRRHFLVLIGRSRLVEGNPSPLGPLGEVHFAPICDAEAILAMKVRSLRNCPFKLVGRDIHIWTVQITAASATADTFQALLDPAEKDRAAQFRFDYLRHSFTITRGLLRVLLGRYLRLSPVEIRLQYGPKGKPALTPEQPLRFNTSHAGDLAVYAFTIGCELGVDVERIRSVPDQHDIAQRFFCPEESAELNSLTAAERELAFYLCWTRKEAYIKAVGDGLSVALDDFRVTLRPGQPARFVHIAQQLGVSGSWTLHDLPCASPYAAALAYHDAERPVVTLPLIEAGDLLKL